MANAGARILPSHITTVPAALHEVCAIRSAVASVSPVLVSPEGGELLTITGSGFKGLTKKGFTIFIGRNRGRPVICPQATIVDASGTIATW
jgi:hypothetical protein